MKPPYRAAGAGNSPYRAAGAGNSPYRAAGAGNSPYRAAGAGKSRALAASAILFGSGLSGLVYQIAWQREFRLVFGSSTAASAAVLTIFIGGIGAGGLVLGRRADGHPRPMQLYARLELRVAATAAATPFLLDLARAIYLRSGGVLALGAALGTTLRLVLAGIVLAAPTVLMGGALPAAVRAVQSDADAGRRTVGLLYGANTLGAVTGCSLATFWLLERLGTRTTLFAACILNAVVALAASLVRAPAASPKVVEPPKTVEPAQAASAPPAFVFAAAGIVGFAFFMLELVWYRLLGPLLGGSVFTFGIILAVALLGIGVGGLAYALFARASRPATLSGFALTCLFEAATLAIPFALGDRMALLALALRPDAGGGLVTHLPGWAAAAGVVVFLPAVAAGAQYPLLVALLGSGRSGVGSQIGAAAACNTVGAMIGSLAGGFLLVPLLSAPGCWRLAAAILVALGLVAAALARPGRLAVAGFGSLAAFAIACLAARGPTAAWRHSPIGAGRVERRFLASPMEARRWLQESRRAIIWEQEGVESSVALDATEGLAMVVNGKIDGNARSDAATQVMGGLLGALLHGAPRSAMVIGLGTGSTAGWLGAVPSIERVDVAELEGAMLHVAEACAPVNERVLENPKVHVLLGDARETLLTAPRAYDVVFSEPSNPYRAGVASLFTREYYEAVAARLAPRGLFVQWLQTYEIDEPTVRSVYATLRAVFPHVETWRLGASDLALVASATPLALDAGALEARVASEPYRRALLAAWRTEGLAGLLAHHLARGSASARLAGGARVNTDDKNHVEFGFARHVGDFAHVDVMLERARAVGEEQPILTGAAPAAARIEEERLMQLAGEGYEPEIGAGLPVDLEVRAAAAVNYAAGNTLGAIAKWEFQERAPLGVTELSLVAEGLAERGDEAAVPRIEELRALEPVEADAILARLRMREGRAADAGEALVRSLRAYRHDPWPSPSVMRRALDLAEPIARADTTQAASILDALAQPFAVRSLDAMRLVARVWVSRLFTDPARCAEAWHELGPSAPWDADSLTERRDCYRRARDPAEAGARRDLQELLSCGASPSFWFGCL